MIPAKSLEIFHKILNLVILILAIIVFVLMVRLVRNEYFTTKENRIVADTETENNDNSNTNSDSKTNSNKDEKAIKNIGKKLLSLVIPDDLEITESDINNMATTPAILQNGKVTIPTNNTKPTSAAVTAATTSATVNNTIFTTQTKVNSEEDDAPMTTTVLAANNNGNNGNNGKNDYEYQSMFRKVTNFLQYPDEQKFCPNIDDSESSFWVQLPEDYAGDYHCKFCCTSCYTLISKEIYCGQNTNGLYILDHFSITDMAKLRELYDSSPELSDKFAFPEVKLNSLLGKAVLKYRYDEEYHTIQVLKTYDELMEHEYNPAISSELYVRHYKCPAMATKPVLQIVNV